MLEARKHALFELKPEPPLGREDTLPRQLQGDTLAEIRALGLVDDAHPPLAELADDPVRADGMGGRGSRERVHRGAAEPTEPARLVAFAVVREKIRDLGAYALVHGGLSQPGVAMLGRNLEGSMKQLLGLPESVARDRVGSRVVSARPIPFHNSLRGRIDGASARRGLPHS